jgi:uncharacterized protein (TIGR03083 family)
VAARPELIADLDPFDLLDVECARVATFFDGLGDADWTAPTRCTEWTVRDMLGHLAFVEDYNRAGLDGTLQDLMEPIEAESLDAVNAWGVRLRAELPAAEVLEQWRTANAAWRVEIRRRGGDGTVDTMVGPYPSWQQAFYLAVEYATHGDDIGVLVTEAEVAGRDAWRAQFTRYGVEEYERPVTVVVVPEGNLVRDDDAEIVLSDHDLAEAGVGRLPAEHPIPDSLRAALACLA